MISVRLPLASERVENVLDSGQNQYTETKYQRPRREIRRISVR